MLSREFLIQRGYCCGHGCLMCPYEPKHKEGNTNMKKRSKSQKSNQFSHYKRWRTDEGYTFLALNEEDAKEYISKTMGDVKTLREVKI